MPLRAAGLMLLVLAVTGYLCGRVVLGSEVFARPDVPWVLSAAMKFGLLWLPAVLAPIGVLLVVFGRIPLVGRLAAGFRKKPTPPPPPPPPVYRLPPGPSSAGCGQVFYDRNGVPYYED
jgi:hypothetical protein